MLEKEANLSRWTYSVDDNGCFDFYYFEKYMPHIKYNITGESVTSVTSDCERFK